MIDLGIMATRSSGIVMVDYGHSSIGQCLGFRERHLFAEGLPRRPARAVIDEAIVGIRKNDVGICQVVSNTIEPFGSPDRTRVPRHGRRRQTLARETAIDRSCFLERSDGTSICNDPAKSVKQLRIQVPPAGRGIQVTRVLAIGIVALVRISVPGDAYNKQACPQQYLNSARTPRLGCYRPARRAPSLIAATA